MSANRSEAGRGVPPFGESEPASKTDGGLSGAPTKPERGAPPVEASGTGGERDASGAIANHPTPPGGGRRLAIGILAGLVLVFGCGLGLGGLTRHLHPSLPPLAETADSGWTPPPPLPGEDPGPTLRRSAPTRVAIGAIGVRAAVKPVGIGVRGDLGVPDVDSRYVGWYERGPSPGEAGPAVLVGHVDSHTSGPAVFYYLGNLERGNEIRVTRRDGRAAIFAVDRVASYPKRKFPYAAVFAQTAAATLRLVTCGGRFDESEGSYANNTVAYATLRSVSKR